MKIIEVPIEKIANWKLNPRSIHEEDIKRLIWQIEHLGVYKPMLVTRALKKDNAGTADWIALGGNQRLKAFNKLGIKEVHCSVVKADSQKKRIEYSLSDNDRAGSYNRDQLNDLIFPEMDNLDLDMFKLDLGELTGLDEFMGVFSVDGIDPPELADGDRAPFRQATFTLHDEQWEEVEAAIKKAKTEGGGESAVNENSNGNALAWICGSYNRG